MYSKNSRLGFVFAAMAISALATAAHATDEAAAGTTVNIVAGIGAPPYGDFGPDGKTIVGYEVDILNAIAKDAGLSLNWTVMDFDAMFPAVDSGRADIVSFGLVDRKSRQMKYDILDNAKDAAGIIATPSLAKEIKSIIDVCGHSLAASSGTSFVTFWDEQSKKCAAEGKPAINVLTFKNEAVAFNALLSGQVEIMTAQFPTLSAFAAKFEGKAEVIPGITYFEGFAGWVFPKNSPHLNVFQTTLQKLIDDGTYKQIMDKWSLGELAVTSAAINQGTAE